MQVSNALQVAQQNYQSDNKLVTKEKQTSFQKSLDSAVNSNNPKIITIKRGDTLSELAKTYNTSVNELAKINNISNPDLIYADNKLVIGNQNVKLSDKVSNNQINNIKSTSSNAIKVSENSSLTNLNDIEKKARDYIVKRESGGSYTARNGKYIGKYQLDSSYLNGDFSPNNQEKVAQDYVTKRYGTWNEAMKHW